MVCESPYADRQDFSLTNSKRALTYALSSNTSTIEEETRDSGQRNSRGLFRSAN